MPDLARHEGGCPMCGKRDCECEAEARRELYPYLDGKLYWTRGEFLGRKYRALWQEGCNEVLDFQWLDPEG